MKPWWCVLMCTQSRKKPTLWTACCFLKAMHVMNETLMCADVCCCVLLCTDVYWCVLMCLPSPKTLTLWTVFLCLLRSAQVCSGVLRCAHACMFVLSRILLQKLKQAEHSWLLKLSMLLLSDVQVIFRIHKTQLTPQHPWPPPRSWAATSKQSARQPSISHCNAGVS